MQKLLLHIVFLSYTLVMLKPAMPYVSDFIGHLFLYSQHMATVHVENGKMHIHKEIVDNAKKETSQKQIPAAKKENSANDHISFPEKESNTIALFKRNFQIPVSAALQYNYLPGDYPPPRA